MIPNLSQDKVKKLVKKKKAPVDSNILQSVLAPNYRDGKKVTKKKKTKSAFHTQRSSHSYLSQKSYLTHKPADKNSILKAGDKKMKKTKKVRSSSKSISLKRSSSNQANLFDRYKNEPGKPVSLPRRSSLTPITAMQDLPKIKQKYHFERKPLRYSTSFNQQDPKVGKKKRQ